MGALRAGDAAQDSAEYNASILERNRVLAEQDRTRNINTARIDSEDKSRENRRRLATIRAGYGSSGLELAGSPLDVLSDTAIEMSLDERRIEFEGQVKGREGYLKAMGLQEQANLERRSGKDAKSASYLNAGSSLISGVTGAASSYSSLK
jgi:hypothetical protein